MTEVAASTDIELRSVKWQFDTGENDLVDITVPYAAIGGQPDKLLLTGLGETDVTGIAGRLAERGINSLAVASLVYPQVRGKLTVPIVEKSVINGTEALVQDITTNGEGIQQAIGNSGGSSQVLMAAYENPGLFRQVVAVAPGFLNVEALGATPKQQARTLMGRFDDAGLTETLSASGDLAAKMAIMKELMSGLAYAAELDAAEIVRALGSKLKIYIGEEDPVTPPAEAEAKLGEDVITRVPGMGHPALLNETGCDELALIMHRERTAGTVR